MDNVLDGFAAAAARHASRIAVSCGAVQLSYRELDGVATALAGAVQSRNVSAERPVAILLDRSADLVVAALAVLKTGACYLPLDPVTPAARLGLILADAAPSLVLTSRTLAAPLPGEVPVLLVDDLDSVQCSYAPVQIKPDAPAYVIFTSGTTGRPKGVQVSHANLRSLFTSTDPLFGFGCDDVWTLFHSFAFDFSVWEMWGALLYGGRLVVVPEEVTKNPTAFRQLLRTERVTVLNQTPTAFTQLSAADARCADRLPLKWVVLGGERLQFSNLRRWMAKYGDSTPKLINMYGITETTVHCSYRRIERADLDCRHSLIGDPLPDLDFLLVDFQLAGENLTMVPDGEIGEIIVLGPGVSLGYLGRPELTAERFVEVADRHGRWVRGYRSGDLAVRTVSGEYEYRGRADDQVKIHGFRIELGEIQTVLTGAPGVTQAVVVVRKPNVVASPVGKQNAASSCITDVRDLVRGGQQISRRAEQTPRIVGYVVPGEGFDLEQIYAYLREHLPPYMVPAFVVAVGSIPVNRNGKVDLIKLPQPSGPHRLDAADSAAQGDDVRVICALFEEVLGRDGVAADDSFFSVGGDSILALKLRAAGLARNVNLELADIYSLHTPRALAAAIRSNVEPVASTVAPFSLISSDDRESLPDNGIEDAYPIGVLQAGLLFHSSYEADATMYCDIFMFRFGVAYHHQAMEQAITRAIARHDILRTSFHFSGFSEPLQLVQDSAETPLAAIDLRHLGPVEQEAELAAWRAREMATGYDFRRPPIMRFTVHILRDQEFQLAMSFHDALLDGWSESSLITEILTDYDLLRRGEHRPVGARPARRYADFIALEQATLRSESTSQFWSDELADVAPTLLPRRVATTSQTGMGFLGVDINPDLSESLDEVAHAHQVSLKHLLLAVHARVLSALTGRDEVIVGVESNGRVEDIGGAEVIGTHLNVVPYRLKTRNQTWRELITAAWAKENQLLAVRRFPYAELQRQIGLPELTDISFNYTHFHSYQGLAGTHLTVVDAKAYIKTHFTLRTEFNKDPFTGLLTLDLEVNLERVGAEQLQWISELYRNALASIAADEYAIPTQRALLGEQQWQELLAGSRGPHQLVPADGFFEIFDRSVATHGARLAARCGHRSLSYTDLATRVGSLAGWLRREGVRPGMTVGLAAARGLDFLTAVLAIMRTGAVYLPLPADPAARVAGMLVRSGAELVLCDQVTRGMLAEAAAERVPVIDLAEALTAAEGCQPLTGPLPGGRNVAYVIFTSGSTGAPKGALIRHDGMLNHLAAKVAVLDLAPGDRVSQDAAATFDISVWQLLAPLIVGATTVIYPDEISQDPPRLLRALGADGITVLEVSPSVLSVLTSELMHYGVQACAPFALRWLLCSGQTLTPRAAGAFQRLLPEVRVLNMWGATEVSDDCTHYELPAGTEKKIADELSGSVPIGRPIRNAAVYVLDENGELAPLGTPGELCVSGRCVGAGYVHDAERTAHAFVPDQFADEPGALMYRTGDRGRRGVNGQLEFLGRLDRQLKVRGHRLELGEVERALATLTELQDSAVIVRTGNDGGTQLAAFVVPTGHQLAAPAPAVQRLELSPAALRASLATVLPRYAIPDLVIQLDALPRTPHGKIDTTALAGWDFSQAGAPPAPDEAPVTPTEAAVIDVWQATLGCEHLGPGAHFFEIGGHSLHATQVMARLQDRLGVDLPLRTIFEHPTIRELAAQLDQAAQEQRPSSAWRIPRRPQGLTEFPLALNQAGLWFLNQFGSTDCAYENGTLLRISGPLDVDAFSVAVDTVTSRHEILFTRFGSRCGIPFQVLRPDTRVRLDIETVVDGARLAADPAEMTRYVRNRMVPGRFDLENGPLAIVRLYQFTPTEYVLDWSSHHIVSDGWSTNVIVAEMREAYLAQIQSRTSRLPELSVQYGDYALWQHQFLRSDEAAQEIRFWSSYLDGYPGELDLATDFERTDDRSRAAGYVTTTWDGALLRRIVAFTGARHTTPFMLFHAVTSVVVAKFGQQSDVVLGAAVAGRSLPGTEHLVGFFAHALPLRYQVDLTSTPNQLLRATTSAALTALEHQRMPLQEIVRALGVESKLGLSPLLQVLVMVDNYPLDLTAFPGLTVSLEVTQNTHSLTDLTFNFVEGDNLRLALQYDSSLFTPDTAQRLLYACDRLLDFFLAQPDRSLNAAVLLSAEDRAALERIWVELTGTQLDFGSRTAETLLASPHWPALIDHIEAHGLLPALLMAL